MKAERYGILGGRYPAVVKSYDKRRRTCRVDVLGLTGGARIFPEAEIEYPIGDKSKTGQYSTEIEILAGDAVWVSFIGGDARYPIITGFRNPESGNSVDWRKFHHKNIELNADEKIYILCGSTTIKISPENIKLQTKTFDVKSESMSFTAGSIAFKKG